MTSQNLAEAIRCCLHSDTAAAAQRIADQMRAEDGVKTAVQSFHRNLPLDRLRCQCLADQPAVWTYNKSLSKPIYLSKTAAQILVDHRRLDSKHLELYVTISW